jgi:WD40 repeat protein
MTTSVLPPAPPATPYPAAALPVAAKSAQAPALRVVRQVGHADKIWAVRFSHDGKYVATGSADRSFKVWDVATRQLLLSYDRNEDHVTAFDLLPTENTAVIGTRLGELYLLNLDSGERRNLETKSDFMTAIAVSPDGRRAIAAARGTVKIWDLQRGQATATLDLKGRVPAGAGFTPRGPVITVKTNQGAEVLAIESGKRLYEYRSRAKYGLETAVISHDGSRLIVGNRKPYDIEVFDTAGFRKVAALPGQHYEIADAALSPDGSQLVTCGRDATVNLWDLKTQSLVKKWKYDQGLTSVDFSPDGHTLVTGAGQTLYMASSALLFDAASGKALGKLEGAEQVTIAAGISADGQYAMTASNTEALTFWDLGTGAKVAAENLGNLLNVHGAAGFTLHDLKDAELSADGKVVAAVGGGASFIRSNIEGHTLVRVLNLASGKSQMIKTDPAGRIDDLALSADGRRVAVAAWNGRDLSTAEVWAWDIPSEKMIFHTHRVIRGDGIAAANVAFSADGNRLFWGGDEDFQLVDLDSGQASRVFRDAQAVRWISVTNDGRYVATSGEGIAVYDTTSGERRSLGDPKLWRARNPLVWLDDGQHLVSTDGFSRLDIWDVATAQITRSIPIAAGGVRSLAASRDGRRVVAASTDGTARVIDIPSGASVQLVAERGEWLMIDDEGYFDASQNGGKLVNLVAGVSPYSIDQLAARNNRPDRLLSNLNAGKSELIAHFKARYRRRLERLGLSEAALATPFAGAPTVVLTSAQDVGGNAQLVARVESTTPLSSYQVYVNQVPVLGSGGKKLSGVHADLQLSVPLTPGANRVELSATNEGGVESLRVEKKFQLRAAVQRTLYFLALGVSRYKNRAYDLAYAHKDALDLSEVAKAMQGKVFARVETHVLTDAQVTKEALKNATGWLADAHPEDTLVVFLAGHGGYSSDADAEYFFLTHDADAKRLRETAAPFELVENLVRDVKPRQKLMLVDTCNSGDRDPREADARPVKGARGARSRALRALTLELGNAGRAPPRSYLFDHNRYIYNDVLRRTGAIVLSSSRGNEVSFETEAAQNGLFTEEILRALTSSVADGNRDGLLDDKELRNYVARAVARQTGDQQHPVVDTDNMDMRIELPIVPQASAVLGRSEPSAAPAATRGLDLSGSNASPEAAGSGFDPCALQTPPRHGCGCALPGQRTDEPAWLFGLGLLAVARYRRRSNRRRLAHVSCQTAA